MPAAAQALPLLAFQAFQSLAATLAHPHHSTLAAYASLAPPSPAVAEALAAPLDPALATAHPELAAAAAGVLELAVLHHPALLDALAFPSALEEKDKATEGAAPAAGAAPALPPTPEKVGARLQGRCLLYCRAVARNGVGTQSTLCRLWYCRIVILNRAAPQMLLFHPDTDPI